MERGKPGICMNQTQRLFYVRDALNEILNSDVVLPESYSDIITHFLNMCHFIYKEYENCKNK